MLLLLLFFMPPSHSLVFTTLRRGVLNTTIILEISHFAFMCVHRFHCQRQNSLSKYLEQIFVLNFCGSGEKLIYFLSHSPYNVKKFFSEMAIKERLRGESMGKVFLLWIFERNFSNYWQIYFSEFNKKNNLIKI